MVDIPNNITTTATFEGQPLTGASFSGEFETFFDADWIRVSLTAGVTYHFYAHDETAGASGGDSFLQLFNSAGTLVASDDNGGVGSNSLFSYTAATSATYFVAINDVNQ